MFPSEKNIYKKEKYIYIYTGAHIVWVDSVHVTYVITS